MRNHLLLGMGFVMSACAGWGSLCDNAACNPVDGGGNDAGGDSSTCDPKTQTCIDDSKGIFVDTKGNDNAAGTRTAPVATIGKALTLAKAQTKPNVYVCAGAYPENVDVKDPVQIYGGLSCADWSYSASNVVTVDPAAGLPLHVTSTSASVSDVKFVAADGANPGDSSVAAFVDTSTVTLLRASFDAGKGVTGSNGATGSNYTSVAQSDASIKGTNATGINSGGAHACTLCTDGKNSVGGNGGTGGGAPTDGQDGQPNLGGTNPVDGKGGLKDPDGVGAGTCTSGDVGPSGNAGAQAPATSAMGALDSAGWKAASGAGGSNGGVGQGGGGGGGGYDGSNTSGGGGGGGCGGCGGAAGTGGGGGGASIALLAFNSTLTLASSELHAGNAGNGGTGAAAQAGQLGGFSGQNINPGCSGGTGGTGGQGGSGAGGAGGVSVGILWKGTNAPTVDAPTTTNTSVATKGNKGVGGSAGVNDGIDGVAQAILQAP